MKLLVTFLLLTILSIGGNAQIVNLQWAKCYGGGNSEEAYDIRQTSDGGYIIAGASNSIDGQVTGNHGGIDYWVVKTDDTGGIQWETSLGGSQDDVSYSVSQTADGGYIVAGKSESDSGIGDIPPQAISIADSEVHGFRGVEYDFWIVKLSAAGVIEWTHCYGGDDSLGWPEIARSVHQTSDLGYIIAGEAISDSPDVYNNHSSIGNPDYWVVKTNDTGALQWTKCYGGSGYEDPKSIKQTSDGGYIVAGESNSNDSQVTGNHGDFDYWVVKINDTGAIQWEKSLGGSGTDVAQDIIQTFDGGYIAAGWSNSNDSQVTGNHGDYDYWVVKLNDTGGIEWENSYGGSGYDQANSIIQTSDSGYVVGGYTGSNDSEVSGNHGNDDYWVIKISKHGSLVWQKCLGGSGNEYADAVRQTADSGVIVSGGSLSTDAEVTGSHGSEDFWVVKLSSCQLTTNPVIVKPVLPLSTTLVYAHYQWTYEGTIIAGATNATYSPTTLGFYSVIVIDSNGCSGTAIPDTLMEGVPSILNNARVSISPNPTTGIIYVNGGQDPNIKVYGIDGALLKEAVNASEISIAEFPGGVYLVDLFNKDGTMILSDRIIKQ